MMMNVCVYCSSSSVIESKYFDDAIELGRLMAQNDITLVYGAGNIGLMGEIAKSVHKNSGNVVGVIPEFMRKYEVAYMKSDELIFTKDMRERKAIMESRADAFIGLPGGFGTLEELMEIITLKQLGRHNKPIVFLNTLNFYDLLISFFEKFYREKFAKEHYRNLYYVAATPSDALDYILSYKQDGKQLKWF